ncbi:MAG: CRTAC1 family protein, partial [Acidobacteriaceae bacterium]|nr:CRTAC1 family protein [Acidobacteriaceae bacterium]
ANGHPDDMINEYSLHVTYKEPLLLFHHEKDGKLHNVSDRGGTAFRKTFAARGLSVGDYDNDGGLDVIIANNGGPPVLLKNNAAKGNNWLGVRLEGVDCNRDAIGARIYWTAEGKRRYRSKNNGGSYLSAHDLREVLGIGTAAKVDELEIHWPAPSKRIEKLADLPVNRYVHIIEGKGIVT